MADSICGADTGVAWLSSKEPFVEGCLAVDWGSRRMTANWILLYSQYVNGSNDQIIYSIKNTDINWVQGFYFFSLLFVLRLCDGKSILPCLCKYQEMHKSRWKLILFTSFPTQNKFYLFLHDILFPLHIIHCWLLQTSCSIFIDIY